MSAKFEYQIELVLNDVLEFHAELENFKDFSTGVGIRDFGLIESAVNAPFQTFDGQVKIYTKQFLKRRLT